ncbi:MAG TPA: proline--tRNA ligase [Frankiaceae bacterium]|jgi:prolyl-tRNA synthetase|nr:proline--tRNA ligase [Frankiaceae bacterium]
MSRLFLRTLRDAPADAEVASHQLLVRGGYVRRVASGLWSWLPLGKIVLDRVALVVREEMDRIGGQEVLLPSLLPKEPYLATGRWDEYGDLLFRLKDRRGGDYLLGPTHEELFTLLVKGEYSSYKDLPVILYQVANKYRDEARPRSGILRGREFVMKDAYSFDIDDAGLAKSYELHREAYVRIFDRLGLDYRIVSAVSGAMGGSASEEFLAPTPVGEDTFVSCAGCGYAANVEAVTFTPPSTPPASAPAMQEVHTPDTPTIESLAAHLGIEPGQTLKNVLVKIDGQPVAVGVPGDRELDIDKLEAALAPSVVEPFEAADFEAHPELIRGYVGPQHGLLTYYADTRISDGTSWVTGANKADHHVLNVTAGRDFTVERYLDVASIADGDPCPRCGEPLVIGRAIEIGHIFQLGRKYANTFELDVLGPDGTPVRVTMGSYGIGVSRAVASIIEQNHDDRGLIWPAAVAPADVHLVAIGKAGQQEAAAQLGESLEQAGLRVLLDDRGTSAGVAFADADLLGVPTIVVVGKGLASGEIEVKDRRSGERRTIPLDGAVAELVAVASPE